ncbi:hypothetical protein RRG08_027625 [Elysia crispata]|uniref:Uncharacterized protein n=1 Tax=Elysia crispata TaxID=231223 RepID=A0AAE1AF47_9GAST|nr:hypothetical protein RRG08_027625 [Elysia crispata]
MHLPSGCWDPWDRALIQAGSREPWTGLKHPRHDVLTVQGEELSILRRVIFFKINNTKTHTSQRLSGTPGRDYYLKIALLIAILTPS